MAKPKSKKPVGQEAQIERLALHARHVKDSVFLIPSSTGIPYVVNADTQQCQCPYFKYYAHCKHLKAVALISRLAKQWGYL